MICKQARGAVKLIFVFTFLLCATSQASADIIDDIKLKTAANGEVDAVIKFTVPVQRLRYFPPGKTQYLVIYFNIVDTVPKDQWQDYESHRSPPSELIDKFTVTTRDLNTGPKIEIQFSSPVEFSMKASKDGRSLKLHIKQDSVAQAKPDKTALTAEVVTPTVALPVIAATPTLPAVPQPPAVAGATAKLAAAGSASSPKPAPAQLGGKDGLPAYPDIAQQAANIPPSGSLTLQEQIKKADGEAAVMMAKARDALLAGQMFAAIEAFNNTLKLPANMYSQDAQIWIGIAREKSGQQGKAILEYETYLKLYPGGKEEKWVKDRLSKLNAARPAPVAAAALPEKAIAQNSELHYTEYGSFSMYYYHGASHTDTVATVGNVQTPSSLTVTDQSSLISNVSMTARAYNEEFDNRLVFQDFFAANFLPGQKNTNRLNAAFFDVKNRRHNYSARIGRQSATGGGVLGRFDGVSAGYGFLPDWRANVVAGRLSESVIGSKPVFYGVNLDFGLRDAIGGSVYSIKQTTNGIADRTAMGGILRYFDQRKTAIAMLDYDTQFQAVNMFTVQGTLNRASGTDYNFLVDRRRTPSLSIRSAVNGTTTSVETLLQNGWSIDDLLKLANSRTAISNMAQFGVTNHIREKWQIGTDVSVANTTGLSASGTLNPDGSTGVEGFVAATPATGNTWTISERLIGSDVFSSRDVSMCSLSLTKSPTITGKTLLLNSHSYFREKWTIDTTLRLYWQNDNAGGTQTITSPMLKMGYQLKSNLTLDAESGIEWTRVDSSALQSSRINRKYISMGFRWDF